MINYRKNVLANGLRVITVPIKETKAVTVLVLVATGSRYENLGESGLAHFLEHMVFKGTKKRPTTLDISRELDAVGANYNAFTSEEETGFYVRVEKSRFPLAIDMLFDIIFNSKFEPQEVQKEKGVILEEINMYQDMPQSQVQNLAKELFYGDTALGRPITGRPEIVKKFNQKDFFQFQHKFYSPKNIIVAIAGASDKSWLKEAREKFADLKPGKSSTWQENRQKQSQPRVSLCYKKTDQAHLILGVRTFSRHDKRRYAMQLINNILGDTMSSRLFIEIREKRGLAYYVGTDAIEFHDAGYFSASAGVDTKRTKEAIRLILEEFAKVKKNGITGKELEQAKENIKGRLYLGLEDSFSVANFLVEQELLWGEIKTPEQILQEIYRVSLSDIIQLAKEIFQPRNLNLALVGPFREKKEFEKLLKI